jgi:hypothetical protein
MVKDGREHIAVIYLGRQRQRDAEKRERLVLKLEDEAGRWSWKMKLEDEIGRWSCWIETLLSVRRMFWCSRYSKGGARTLFFIDNPTVAEARGWSKQMASKKKKQSQGKEKTEQSRE